MMIATAISRGLVLLTAVIVARMLGKEIFGEYSIVRSTINTFLIFASFGLGITSTKYISEFRVIDKQKTGHILALTGFFAAITGFLFAFGLFLCSGFFAVNVLKAPHLSYILKLCSIVIFLNALNGCQTGSLSGFEAFQKMASVNFYVALFSLPCLIGGAYFFGLVGAVWGLVLNSAIQWCFNHVALRVEARRFNVPFIFKATMFKELPVIWKFALPAMMTGLMVVPVNWFCEVMLVNQPQGYGEMGVYSAANQWRITLFFLPSVLAQIFLPLLSNLKRDIDIDRYKRLIKYNIAVNLGVVLIVSIPVVIFSKYIMKSYGEEFIQGWPVLIVLVLSVSVAAINTVVAQIAASENDMWVCFGFNMTWAALLLLFASFLLNYGLGAMGLAWAVLISYLGQSLVCFLYLHRNGAMLVDEPSR